MCPTFGRFPAHGHLLGHSVWCFTRQKYDNKEMVILNDAPNQTLVCSVPGVRVINCPSRFRSLGEKRNALIAHSRGEILLPWDDDDIHLSGRMSQAAEMLDGFEYWNPQASWYVNPVETSGKMSHAHKHGVCHNASAFRAGAVWYDPVSGGEDRKADIRAKVYKNHNPRNLISDPESWQYIYRFGVGKHISSVPEEKSQAEYDVRSAAGGMFSIVPLEPSDFGAWMLQRDQLLHSGKADSAVNNRTVNGPKVRRPNMIERLLGVWTK